MSWANKAGRERATLRRAAQFALGVVVCVGGCGDVQEAVEQSVSGAVATARSQVQGRIDLSLSPPLALETCTSRWIPGDDGRPGVLQWTSYAGDSPDAFPCVFLQLEGDGATPENLEGKTVRGRLYVQLLEAGPILHSPDDRPVEAVVREATTLSIACEIANSVLVSTENDEPITFSGKLVGTRL